MARWRKRRGAGLRRAPALLRYARRASRIGKNRKNTGTAERSRRRIAISPSIQ